MTARMTGLFRRTALSPDFLTVQAHLPAKRCLHPCVDGAFDENFSMRGLSARAVFFKAEKKLAEIICKPLISLEPAWRLELQTY